MKAIKKFLALLLTAVLPKTGIFTVSTPPTGAAKGFLPMQAAITVGAI